NDRRASDRCRNLGNRYNPEVLRQQDESRCRDHGDTGDNHPEPLMICRVDKCSKRRGDEHSCDVTESESRSDQPTLPSMCEKENADEWPNTGLHIRHEEAKREKWPDLISQEGPGRPGLVQRPSPFTCALARRRTCRRAGKPRATMSDLERCSLDRSR